MQVIQSDDILEIFQELKSRTGKEPPKSSSGRFCAQLSFFPFTVLYCCQYCISHLLQMFNSQCVGSNSRSNVDDTIRGEEGTDHLYLGNFYLFIKPIVIL